MACGILGPLGALLMNLVVAGRLSRRIQAVEENARRLAHGLPLEPFSRGSDEDFGAGPADRRCRLPAAQARARGQGQRAALSRSVRPRAHRVRRDRPRRRDPPLQPGGLQPAQCAAGPVSGPQGVGVRRARSAGDFPPGHDGAHRHGHRKPGRSNAITCSTTARGSPWKSARI